MFYTKEGLDIIELGEEEGTVVFDSDTGDTTVLDSIGADIFKCFSHCHDIDSVVSELAKIYNEDPQIIKNDVAEFIDTLTKQGLLLEQEE